MFICNHLVVAKVILGTKLVPEIHKLDKKAKLSYLIKDTLSSVDTFPKRERLV